MSKRNQRATTYSALFAAIVLLILLGVSTRTQGENSSEVAYMLSVPHSSAAGLEPGMSVEMLGRPIGKVNDVTYAKDGSAIQLTLMIDAGHSENIVSASRVVINQSSGNALLEIIRDEKASSSPAGNQRIEPGAAIKFAKPDPIKNATSQSVFKTIASFLPSVMQNFGEASDFMSYMATDADELMTDVSDLVNVETKELVSELDEVTASLQVILRRTDAMMSVLEGEMQHVPGTMQQVRRLLDETDHAVQRADCVLYQAGEMVDAVRNRPLIRRMVNRNQRQRCR